MVSLYSGAVVDLTAILIRAGFGGVLVDDEDHLARQNLRRCTEQLDVSEPVHYGLILAALVFPTEQDRFLCLTSLRLVRGCFKTFKA